jgi:hypothetical protein
VFTIHMTWFEGELVFCLYILYLVFPRIVFIYLLNLSTASHVILACI